MEFTKKTRGSRIPDNSSVEFTTKRGIHGKDVEFTEMMAWKSRSSVESAGVFLVMWGVPSSPQRSRVLMGVHARVSRCSPQFYVPHVQRAAHLEFGWLRAPPVSRLLLLLAFRAHRTHFLSGKPIRSDERGRAQKPEWHSARLWSAYLSLASCD